MNPRQRRGILLLIATSLGALAVFVAVLSLVADVRSQVGPLATVFELGRDVQALQAVTPEMLEEVELPERWVSDTAIRSLDDVIGKVAASTYASGSVLQTGMLVDPPGLQAGYREVAILVDAETGVAGKVQPGDHVDIIATTPGARDDLVRDRAEVWVSNALVLEVGLPRDVEEADSSGNYMQGRGVPVTFALPVSEAVRLAYAESFSLKLRLALRGRGDEGAVAPQESVYELPVATGAGEGGDA